MTSDNELHWYAFKVFYNRVAPLRRLVERDGVTTYLPIQVVEKYKAGRLTYQEKPLIPSLLFVHATEAWVRAFKWDHESDFLCYSEPGTNRPAPIPDAEMKSFRIITSVRGRPVEVLPDVPAFRRGERVRVVAGIYQGVEGYVKKIKSDRKLLVALEGIAIVAVSYIDPAYLEKLD